MRGLVGKVLLRLVLGIPFIASIFFVTAGTIDYWQAWVYMAVLFLPVIAALAYFLRRDPAFLERRMRMKEREASQGSIVAAAGVLLAAVFVLPGLDQRFGWSQVPVAVVLGADLLVLVGYGIVYASFHENTWASRVIEVEAGQEVITTGPYRIVRHPMYVGVLVMYLATPLALGSWWALLPALGLIPTLMARAKAEEVTLERDLDGYRAYEQVTRFRLIPGIW